MEVEKEQKHFELIFDGKTAVELTHVCSGFLSTMVAGAPNPLVMEIDTDDPFFSELSVKIISTIDFTALVDLKEAVLHITRGDQREAYSFTPKVDGQYTLSRLSRTLPTISISTKRNITSTRIQASGPRRSASVRFHRAPAC